MKILKISLFILSVTAMTNCSTHKNDSNMSNPVMSEQDAIQLVKPFYDFLGGDATLEQVLSLIHI